MLDKTADTQTEPVEATDASAELITVKVTKGGTIQVNMSPDVMPDRMYKAILIHGLQKLINRKTKADMDLTPDARAAKNLAAMYANTYKLVGSKAESGKASGPVMIEATRIAKLAVKAEMKAQKIKVSHVASSEITRLAKELIEADPSFIKTAEASLKAAEAMVGSKATAKLSIKVDPKLVQAAEAKKAKDKATAGQTLSAKQAGKVQVKSKPQATR